MPSRDYGPLVVPALMLVGICVFLTGVGWGLPSRSVDEYLFGNNPVWSGEQILVLAGDRGRETVGADVDRDPSAPGSVLNDTDTERAQIIRRYRLFTYQPDEMITLMAIGSMRPAEGDFDPKLYQYGGLWIYPVAGLLKLSGPIQTQAWYLDRPQAFGWFYVLGRLYSATWGLAGVWAVYRLVYGSGGGTLAAMGAGLIYLFLPVVVNQAHEAKPHLAGAVLVLFAVLAGGRFVETGQRRWWIVAGVLCGAAMGMILSAGVSLLILPAMVLMRPMNWGKRAATTLLAVLFAVAVYFVSNPYVLRHLLGDGQILRSNLSNSAAMYPVGVDWWAGIVNSIQLIAHGTTPVAAVAGLIGAIVIAARWKKEAAPAVLLLVIVGAVILVQFVLLAAGKPGEYARFAIVPSIALAICATTWIGRARIRVFEKVEALGLLIILAVLPSAIYLRGYSQDAGTNPRRMEDARLLHALELAGARTLGMPNEPAPYNLPPVNVFHWNLLRLPREFDMERPEPPVDVIVRPVDILQTERRTAGNYVLLSERKIDDLFPSKISWAGKSMEIWVRRSLIRSASQSANE